VFLPACTPYSATDTLPQLYEGPRFDISARLPFVLNTLAVTMVLSPALPLLLPLATAGFAITYSVSEPVPPVCVRYIHTYGIE
jgi:hypothetical protein